MATATLTSAEVTALVSTVLARCQLTVPAEGLQDWHDELVNWLNHLDQTFIGLPHVRKSATDAAIEVIAGSGQIGGTKFTVSAETVDLSSYNNDTAYVWVYLSGGTPTIGKGTDAAGWPATDHLPLAEVTLASGVVTTITDRRGYAVFGGGGGGTTTIDYAATTGEDIAKGELVYFNAGNLELAQANAIGTSEVAGMCSVAASSGNSARYVRNGPVELADWTSILGSASLTPGTIYYLSTSTAGAIQAASPSGSGECIVRIGQAQSSTVLDVQIQPPIALG